MEFVQTLSAQIPWSHNCAILDKVKEFSKREWYIRKTCENGWSHSVLIHQIESGLYERQTTVDKISNFESRLAAPQSELAVQKEQGWITALLFHQELLFLISLTVNSYVGDGITTTECDFIRKDGQYVIIYRCLRKF